MTQVAEQEIYKAIKQAIIQQKLAPNTQLVEDILAESFGVSRTPIRNVLRRLAHEKLVTIIPHKGTFVACPSVDQAREVFEMRKTLEAAATRQACKHLTQDHIRQLKAMISEERRASTEGDLFEALQISCDFHLKIAELAGNSFGYRYIEELISLNYVIMAYYGHRQLKLCGSLEHDQIVNAMIEGNEQLAERLMSEHLKEIENCLDFDGIPKYPLSLSEVFQTSQEDLSPRR
ncbi:GntR family transcriptional regulator [Brevibacillus sp. B_LB10_24]|uniref:GntR family transcriptional regulator n=1 Tax=Brevibacillus sp. B_LB10_24 TaxID=3380645 RepID=UPI0038B78448